MDAVLIQLILIIIDVVNDALCVSDCFIHVNSFSVYNGTVSVTETGKTCQRWDSSTPHVPNYIPIGDQSNYCRDPSGWPNLWCYTMDPNTRWEDCSVPQCTETSTMEITTQNHHDISQSTGQEVTSQNRLDISESTSHEMTSQNIHDITDSTSHDMTSQSIHDISESSSHEMTSQTTDITIPDSHYTSESTVNDITSPNLHFTAESTTKMMTTPNSKSNTVGHYSKFTDSSYSTNSYQSILGLSDSKTTATHVPTSDTCTCPCNPKNHFWLEFFYGNLTKQEKTDIVENEKRRIKRELTVLKTTLSSYKRTKTSARDKRNSSRSMGYLGIGLLTSVLFLIVIIDLSSVCGCCSTN